MRKFSAKHMYLSSKSLLFLIQTVYFRLHLPIFSLNKRQRQKCPLVLNSSHRTRQSQFRMLKREALWQAEFEGEGKVYRLGEGHFLRTEYKGEKRAVFEGWHGEEMHTQQPSLDCSHGSPGHPLPPDPPSRSPFSSAPWDASTTQESTASPYFLRTSA